MTLTECDGEALERLQAAYTQSLDCKRMDQWLALFSSDPAASYVCTTRENLLKDMPLALMMDDCHARLEDRVTYVTKVWAGTFEDYQTRHLTQRLQVSAAANGMTRMVSSFVVFYTSDESGVSKILVTGEYDDLVDCREGSPRFFSKRTILDTSVLPRYIVYPL